MSFKEDLTSIADAIRERKNLSELLSLEKMARLLEKDSRKLIILEQNTSIDQIIQNTETSGNGLIDTSTWELDFSNIEGAKKIKSKAFYETALKKVNLGSVEKVANYAFYNCQSLTEVTAENLKTIESNAFYNCLNLTSFSASKVEKIGNYAFYMGLSAKSEMLFDFSSVREIGAQSFYGCKISAIDAPKLVKIGNYAFAYNKQLQEVNCPLLETVPTYCFADCTSLSKITLPEVKTISSNAFLNCSSLKEVEFSNLRLIYGNGFPSTIEKLILKGKHFCVSQAVFPSNCTIYVEPALIDSYKKNSQWKGCNIVSLEEVSNNE